jgi:hypothetical protein
VAVVVADSELAEQPEKASAIAVIATAATRRQALPMGPRMPAHAPDVQHAERQLWAGRSCAS